MSVDNFRVVWLERKGNLPLPISSAQLLILIGGRECVIKFLANGGTQIPASDVASFELKYIKRGKEMKKDGRERRRKGDGNEEGKRIQTKALNGIQVVQPIYI